MTSKSMVRRAVTAGECKWNVNIGMAFSIRAVPVSEAIDPNSVNYNMDNPPVLEPQDGPGSDAVALLDPTWDADNPRPFAYVFTADNRQFKITTTGVRTSIDRLRAVADEIAAALLAATPVEEASVPEPTLDACVYPEAVIVALFGGTAGDALTQEPNMPTSSCRYQGSAGRTRIEFTMTFGGDPLVPPDNMDPEYTLIDSFGADVYMKDTSSTAGYKRSRRVYQIARPGGRIRLDLTVSEEDFPEAVIGQILRNLIARTI